MPNHNRSRTRALENTEDLDEDGTSSERPSKARRIRLACLRCQKRKIKCDGSIPKCGSCQKANTDCVDGKKTGNEGGITRTEAAALHSYIQTLETTLRDKQPHMDLTSLRPSGYTGELDLQADSVPSHNVILPPAQESHARTISITHLNAENESTLDSDATAHGQSHTAPHPPQEGEIAHEIGLVPLSAGVNKYVGPSSGFALTKFILNRARRDTKLTTSLRNDTEILESPSTTVSRAMLTIQPGSLPTSFHQAVHLSRTYFEHVHIQYPFLHEPTFFDLLRMTYKAPDYTSKWAQFQVTMVLAIAASILAKRLPIPFSGESLCALAMRDLEHVDVQSSLEGLQCLLLVYMFTLHSPFLAISPWYLNYQFLATVIDLGLQRDLAPGTTVTNYDREMRTRIFWVVYTIDRTLATTLGRPIGLRDEACDLRQPRGVEDFDLHNPALEDTHWMDFSATIREGSMSCAKTLFHLAQLNSEIKYILHSVNKVVPAYTYPQIPDITAWQEGLWKRLQECDAKALEFEDDRRHLTIICSIRYHELVMHLFRPTPHIRSPGESSLGKCYTSAEKTIGLWKELYEADKISYSWITIHSVCLSALTILYCVWTSPTIAAFTLVDQFTSVMCDISVLLSAAGEHWVEARRSRTRLDNLARATTRWLMDKLRATSADDGDRHRRRSNRSSTVQGHTMPDVDCGHSPRGQLEESNRTHAPLCSPAPQDQPLNGSSYDQNDHLPNLDLGFDGYINNQDLASFLGAPEISTTDNSFLMEGMFVDYQPLFEFNSADSGMMWSF